MATSPKPAGLRLVYPLRSPRLDLRPVRPSDLKDLQGLYCSPAVARFLPWSEADPEFVQTILAERQEQATLTEVGAWLVLAAELRETGRVVGEVWLRWVSADDAQGEVAGQFVADVWGQGLAAEGAAVMLDVGFGQLGLHRIVANITAANAGSAAVLRKLGMRREALFREAARFEGAWADKELYAITDQEWADHQ